MIGQPEVSYIAEICPFSDIKHAMMFVGLKGCGKHHALNLLCSRLAVPCIDITEDINREVVQQMESICTPTFFSIDITKVAMKNQNPLLKILEEANSNCYMILLCDDTSLVLPTVVNRCQVIKFRAYTKEDLEHFTKDKNLLKVCSTPGDVMYYQKFDIPAIMSDIDNIYGCIGNASPSNIISVLPDRLSYGDSDTKIDVSYYTRLILCYLLEKFILYPDTEYKEAYNVTNRLLYDLDIPNVNKRQLYENYLLKIKEIYTVDNSGV